MIYHTYVGKEEKIQTQEKQKGEGEDRYSEGLPSKFAR